MGGKLRIVGSGGVSGWLVRLVAAPSRRADGDGGVPHPPARAGRSMRLVAGLLLAGVVSLVAACRRTDAGRTGATDAPHDTPGASDADGETDAVADEAATPANADGDAVPVAVASPPPCPALDALEQRYETVATKLGEVLWDYLTSSARHRRRRWKPDGVRGLPAAQPSVSTDDPCAPAIKMWHRCPGWRRDRSPLTGDRQTTRNDPTRGWTAGRLGQSNRLRDQRRAFRIRIATTRSNDVRLVRDDLTRPPPA